ncbi:C39 family peptidase [Actinocorallia aurea]
MSDQQAVRRAVPALTQFATPGLIASIVYDGRPAEDDPGWAASGAPTRADYGIWSRRWCGLTCLRMALLARDGQAPTLWELRTGALAHGVYEERDDGTTGPGLLYRPFVGYAAEHHGLSAEVITDLTPQRLRAELDAGRLVIASVHVEIRRPDRPSPGRGGHLVLATAHPGDTVHFHNPSGHTPETVAAALPAPTFDSFAARRGIALHL